MAKKGQPVQLQIEVTNDEEWEKLLQRDGLIVVDVYSEWCGPCLGMQANLKKIKLEYGAELLHLAVAKSDGITALERFRNKSEPTWMFISKGKMVGLMFGANAPKLSRMIIEELKKEQAIKEGLATERSAIEVTELSEEERERRDVAENIEKEIREKEERKIAKELLERRTKECENILTNLPNYGTALIFPSARDKYKEVLNEILDEAGLNVHQTEKIHLNEDSINELCYFTDVSNEFSEEALEELLNEESLMVLFKIASRADIEDIDEAILTMFYGGAKEPPGDADCAAIKLVTQIEETEDSAAKELPGVWVPLTAKVRATALRMFFPNVSFDFTIPAPPPEPEHLAIIYSLEKKDEVLPIMQQFSTEVMKHGVFTSENPDSTQLVSKNLRKLDKVSESSRTYTEKIVLQVSKKKSECVLTFAQLEPVYMSPNAKQGKIECDKFFPEDYYESENEDETAEEIIDQNLAQEQVDDDIAVDSGEKEAEEGENTESEVEAEEGKEGEEGTNPVEAEEGVNPAEAGEGVNPAEAGEGESGTALNLPNPPSEEPLAEG